MMMVRRCLFLTILCTLFPSVLHAALPKPTDFVNDFANVISPTTRHELSQMLTAFEEQSSIEIVVTTLPTLDEQPIENYAVDLYKAWGIGKKGKDNGVLFLIAPRERRLRIEVGYGLEGILNDALTGRILDQEVLPRLKKGEVTEGIAAGTLTILNVIATAEKIPFDLTKGARRLDVDIAASPHKLTSAHHILKLLMLLLMLYLFLRHPWFFLFLLSSGGGSGMGGGGFSQGFGGFGGGSSGGGGSSRSW